MEKDTLKGSNFEEIPEARKIASHVIQPGSPREFLQRRLGEPKNQRAEEGSVSLAQWEAQWQQFLRTLENPQSGWGMPPLPEKASPWEDAKAFLASFEQVAEACQWPQEEWVTRLLPALSGEAKWAFNCLGVPDREDYGKVKAAILRGEALSQEKQRQQFRGFGYQEAEGPRGAYRRLWEMCHGWLRVENHSKEQILEVLVLEQLLNVLPSEIQSWVRESGPGSCSQAVAMAEELLFRQEKQVHLEEAARSISEAGQDPSESEWRDLLMDIKEEEDIEASPLAGRTGKMVGEFQRSSLEIAVEEDPEGNYSDPGGIKRKEGTDTDEKRGKYILFQTGGSHEFPVQEERPAQKIKNEDLISKWRIDCREKENESLSVGKTFLQERSIVFQEQIYSGEKSYNCLECRRSFSCLTALTSHQRIHSGNDEENKEDKELPGLPLGMKGNFRNPDDPKRQTGTQLVEKRDQAYPCQGGDFCEAIHLEEKPFISSGSDKNFSDGKKGNVNFPKPCRMKTYNCFQCGKYVRYKSHFLVHQRRHTWKKFFECSECGKKFTENGNLQRHKKIHTAEKPFECVNCGKSFSQNYYLQQHLRTHTGEKPFECSVCGKRFTEKGSVRQHQRIHTGEKPFECSNCGKKFNRNYDLQRHQRIHRKEKPFECSECGRKFSQNSHLRRHQKMHMR